MTKERRLAIQMWEEIVVKCKSGEPFNVSRFKEAFCKEHNLTWVNNCYYCQYFQCCTTCPLVNCMLIYHNVRDDHDVISAEKILNTLRGGAGNDC